MTEPTNMNANYVLLDRSLDTRLRRFRRGWLGGVFACLVFRALGVVAVGLLLFAAADALLSFSPETLAGLGRVLPLGLIVGFAAWAALALRFPLRAVAAHVDREGQDRRTPHRGSPPGTTPRCAAASSAAPRPRRSGHQVRLSA